MTFVDVGEHPSMDTGENLRLGSVTEAAAEAGVHPKTIRRYIRDGHLTGYRFGVKLLRVDLDEVAQLVRPIGRAS